jgi:hypothetical protein
MKGVYLSILAYLVIAIVLAVGIWLVVPGEGRGSSPWLLIVGVVAYVAAVAKYGCTNP